MKGYLITGNWLMSFVGASVDTELSPLWVVLLMYAWFFVSTLLMNLAHRKGWLNRVVERFKLDEV